MTAPMRWDQIQALLAKRRQNPNYTEGGYTASVDAAGADAMARGGVAQDAYLESATNFDASKSLNAWAEGAYTNVRQGLNRTLGDLAGRAVGAGRLNTGFFDEDQGRVITDTMANFNADLAEHSMQAVALQQANDRELGEYGQRETEFGTDVAQSRREELINARREAEARRRQKKRGIGSLIGGVVGAAGGFALGGPAGAAGGWRAGSQIGGSF